jgi:hypothetical protein
MGNAQAAFWFGPPAGRLHTRPAGGSMKVTR